MSGIVLAAIDLGPSSARVLYHAAGFARLMSADLRVLHVTSSLDADTRRRLEEFRAQHSPYEVDPDEGETVLRTGTVSDEIFREAEQCGARLVVMGSRGHSRVASLLLGSTSAAVLANAPAPVLLVPPIDYEIVDMTDRPSLNCGPLVAAVDLAEDCSGQLAFASELAKAGRQPLVLMTVAPKRLSDEDAAKALRARGQRLTSIRPHAMIVRRGDVPRAIANCALEERSGLVVMGLRSPGRGRPGVVASAVLGTKSAFVLAVPCEWSRQ